MRKIMPRWRTSPSAIGVFAGLWLATIFVLAAALELYDDLLFALVVLVVPGVLLLAFLVAVPAWLVISALIRAFGRRYRSALLRFAVLPLGLAMMLLGAFAGDQWLAFTQGARLAAAVADVAQGRQPDKAIDATATAAYMQTGSFFDTVHGIAYDPTDHIEAQMALPPDQRSKEWRATMPRVLSCSGGVQHLGGHFWRTTLDPYDCAED